MTSTKTTCSCDTLAVQDQQLTAVISLDRKLRVTYMNPAAEILFSVGSSKAIGIPIQSIVNLPASLISHIDDVLELERPYSEHEVTIKRPGLADPVVVDCYISHYLPPGGNAGILLEIHNINQQVRIARENAMFSQQEFSRTLLRGLAHEIKNPLGGIRGAAQLLGRELNSEELHEYTDIIIREADRLHELIDRMLGPHTLPIMEQVNIHEVMEHVRKLIKAEAAQTITLDSDYDPSIPSFSADRDHLVQVILNITRNSLQALNDTGTILFKTRVARYVTIGSKLHKLVGLFEIIDDGPGVPDDLMESIFYPMITGRADGTGLGLSIAQSLVNQQNGIIECRSSPESTVFTIIIPLESDSVS